MDHLIIETQVLAELYSRDAAEVAEANGQPDPIGPNKIVPSAVNGSAPSFGN